MLAWSQYSGFIITPSSSPSIPLPHTSLARVASFIPSPPCCCHQINRSRQEGERAGMPGSCCLLGKSTGLGVGRHLGPVLQTRMRVASTSPLPCLCALEAGRAIRVGVCRGEGGWQSLQSPALLEQAPLSALGQCVGRGNSSA